MKFQDFDLKVNNTISTIKINDQQVEVKQYLPMKDKIDLVQIALQKSEEDGIYNDMKLDVYFHLNIVYLYTNIEFEDEDREDEIELYDRLESNGVITNVLTALPDNEYADLREYVKRMTRDSLRYKNTAAAVLTRIIQDLPKNAAAAKEIIDSFDQEKYQAVENFATAANGGRNIRTNLPVD